jgi:hypothetical protein
MLKMVAAPAAIKQILLTTDNEPWTTDIGKFTPNYSLPFQLILSFASIYRMNNGLDGFELITIFSSSATLPDACCWILDV